MSPDPGHAGASLASPESWDAYTYTLDNPETLTDPTGTFALLNLTSNPEENMFWSVWAEENQECGCCSADSLLFSSAAHQLSPRGLSFIERWEGGFHSHVYDASGKKHLGDWTIGYGHRVLDPAKYSKGITQAQAAVLLEQDVATAVAGVNRYATATLGQSQFDALVSFTFNVGVYRFEHSSLRADIVLGNRVPERDFTEYDMSGGQFNPGLLDRRRAEYELYTSW